MSTNSAEGLPDLVVRIRRGAFDNIGDVDAAGVAAVRAGTKYGISRADFAPSMQFRARAHHTRPARIEPAEVVHVENRPTTRVVVIRCPFAHRHEYKGRGHQFHTHGWRHGTPAEGQVRVPHCDRDPGANVFYRLDLMHWDGRS